MRLSTASTARGDSVGLLKRGFPPLLRCGGHPGRDADRRQVAGESTGVRSAIGLQGADVGSPGGSRYVAVATNPAFDLPRDASSSALVLSALGSELGDETAQRLLAAAFFHQAGK